MKIDSLFKFEFDYYHMQNAIECLKSHNIWVSLKLFIEIEHNSMTRHSDWNHPFILHSLGSDRYRYEVKYCRRIQFGCVFYLSFLAKYGVRWIKFIAKCKIYMYISRYIHKCAKSNLRLLLNNYIPPNIVHDKYNTYIGILLKKINDFFLFFITSSIEELHLLKQKKTYQLTHLHVECMQM